MNKTAKRGRPLPDVPDLPKCLLLHAFFVGLDHLFDHLAADGACLAGGEVAVIALLEVDADFAASILKRFIASCASGTIVLLLLFMFHSPFFGGASRCAALLFSRLLFLLCMMKGALCVSIFARMRSFLRRAGENILSPVLLPLLIFALKNEN